MGRFQPHADLTQLALLPAMTPAELDALPFGAIRLDTRGTILSYNAAEARLAGRDPKKVIGKNFFTEVAPCTNVREFAGTFRRGIATRELHTVFPFVFTFPTGPVEVAVTLYFHKPSETAWVLVRGAAAALP